jgi:hypothetical protein
MRDRDALEGGENSTLFLIISVVRLSGVYNITDDITIREVEYRSLF